MRPVALLLCLLASPAFAQSTQTIPFRRMTDPVQLAVGPTAQATMIPPDRLKDPGSGAPLNSFLVVTAPRPEGRGFCASSDIGGSYN